MSFGVHLIATIEVRDGRPSPAGFRDLVSMADDYGFERITTGEHSSGGRLECITALAVMAMSTRTAHVGPMVTNGITRDVGVSAAAVASLDSLSGGRSFYVLGRGNAGIRNAGLRPSSVSEARAYFLALRDLLRTGHAAYRGRQVVLDWPVRPSHVPLYMVAEGPIMLGLAGEIADGVYIGSGLLEDVVADNLQRVRAGALRAGRDPADLDIWWEARCAVAASHDEAVRMVRESLSSVGNHALRGDYAAKLVPEELVDPLREYHARYNYRKHGRRVTARGAVGSGPPTNADLMDELGLTGYFLDRFGVVGTPQQVIERLERLRGLGVDRVNLNAWDRADLRLLGEQVLPKII